MGQAFDYKWQGSGYAHPPNHELTIQALHWARLAAQADPKNQTILILTNPDWHSGVVMLQLALELLVLFLYVCMVLESFTPLAW
jgi:hypothetical protein